MAITVFGVATLIEIGAYYLPWLDNFLDSISIPVSVVAGIVVSAALFGEMDPLTRWALAAISGGGSAGIVSAGMAGIRLGSTMLTGGGANPIVSTFEWVFSLVLSILAVVVPVLAAIIAIACLILLCRFAFKALKQLLSKKPKSPSQNPPPKLSP